MAADAVANFAYSTVATAPSPATSGTSLVVAAGQGALFPAVPFNAVVWAFGAIPTSANAEIVRVTARSTDTLTITRTQESTSARTIVVGDQIAAAITAKTLTDLVNNYVESPWTPSLGGNTTYSIQDGTYTRVGRMCHVRGQIAVTTIGTGATGTVSGLPFPASLHTAGTVGYFATLANSQVFLSCYMAAGASSLKFVGMTAAGTGTSDPAVIFGNGTNVTFAISYPI